MLLFTNLSYSQKIRVLTLNEAISLAERNNSDLILAKMGKMQADQKVSEVYSENLVPSLSLSSSYVRAIKKQFLLIQFPGFSQLVSLTTDNTITNTLNISEPIPILGTPVFSGIKIAQLYSSFQNESVNQTESKVKADVKKAYLNVLLSKEVIDVNKLSLDNSEENLRVVEARYKTGIVTEFDYLRAKVKVSTLKPTLSQSENNLLLAKKILKNTIGLKTEEDIDVTGSLTYDTAEMSGNNDNLIKKIVDENVAVRQLNISKMLNDELVKVNKSSFLPKVYVFGNYTLQALQDDNMPITRYPFGNSINAGIGLTWDLNFFGNSYKKEQSVIEVKKTEEQISSVKDKLKTQSESILLRIEDARNRIKAQSETIQEAERGLELANINFKSGVINQIDVLDAELTLSQVKLLYIQAVYDYLIARTELEQLLEK
jgi:outer membrane protein TolC